MTTNEMLPNVGKLFSYNAHGLRFIVRCIDTRTVYGKLQLHVQPLDGTGDKWVDRDSLLYSPGNV